MRRSLALVLAVWATTACVSSSAEPAPAATPTPALPAITPAPVGPPVRILWAPAEQTLPVSVRVEPGVRPAPAAIPLIPATAEAIRAIEGQFVSHFTSSLGFISTLQNLRDQKYHGSEEWMFKTTFAPGPFADRVREMVTTQRENETRVYHAGQAVLENAWRRPSKGPFGEAADIGLVEGTITFTEEVVTGAGTTVLDHRWRIRALGQGQFVIVGGAETPAELEPLAPFDAARLDTELASQVSAYLQQESVGPTARPMSPFKGTAFWDARGSALEWLRMLADRGALTDRHFDDVRARVTAFTPTSFLGDGFATVELRGTLVEQLNGSQHAYPFTTLVKFQRFSFAQPYWQAIDGLNDDGTWIAKGSYGTPEPTSHG